MTGPELRAVRLALGLNQREFGELIGRSSPVTICHYEVEKVEIPAWVAEVASYCGRAAPLLDEGQAGDLLGSSGPVALLALLLTLGGAPQTGRKKRKNDRR